MSTPFKKNITIFGTGAFARKAYQCACALGYIVTVFVDEDNAAHSPISSVPVVLPSGLSRIAGSEANLFVAIGNAKARNRVMDEFVVKGWHLPSLFHPKSYIAPDAVIGEGVFIAAISVVESCSKIGRGSIVDVGAVIDHDCTVGDFYHIKPGEILLPGTIYKT